MRKSLFQISVSVLTLSILFSGSAASALSEYYSISRSVRALGMGGAFYGLSDDEHALFYNPAGLSLYEGGSQFKWQIQGEGATNIPSVINSLSDKGTAAIVNDISKYSGTPLYAGVTPMLGYYLRKHLAVGLLVADTKVDIALLGRDLASQIDVTAISDTGLFIGYGTEVIDNLHIGFNVKGMMRAGGTKNILISDIAAGGKIINNISDLGGAGAGVDFDLGSTYILPDVYGVQESISLVLNNALASKFTIARQQGAPPGLPRLLTLAGHLRLPGYGWLRHVDAVLDLAEFELGGETDDNRGARYGSVWKHVNFGFEVPIGWFYFRTGFHQGNITGGVGVDARFLRLDLATYAEEDFLQPGQLTSRRVALSLAFGWGGAAPQMVAPQTHPTEPPMSAPETAPPVKAPLAPTTPVVPPPALETPVVPPPAPAAPDAPPAPAPTVAPTPVSTPAPTEIEKATPAASKPSARDTPASDRDPAPKSTSTNKEE